MNQHEQRQFYELITASLEGQILPEQFSVLKNWLNSSQEAVDYYVDYMAILSDIRSSEQLVGADSGYEPYDMNFWDMLSEHEKTAPVLEPEVSEEGTEKSLIQKVEYPECHYRINWRTIVPFISAAAAMILLLLFVRYAPTKGSNQVAVLTDSLNAKWADGEKEMVKGTAIAKSDKSLFLREGYAELLLNNQAKVTIEAPAEFEVLAEDSIKLTYGRMYATVPREAIGFTVKTLSAQIVDLGTEFGVQTDFQGDTLLHVMKGKTVLIAGDKSNKVSIEVKNGVAKKVLAATLTFSDIPCNDRFFVRAIDSAGGLVWRGETEISLANIISGGNGFGKIHSLIGLDPASGKYISLIKEQPLSKGSNDYNLVADSAFIDGVFIPDGDSIVSSLDDTFKCPDTTGEYTHGIVVSAGDINTRQNSIPRAVFNGHPYVNNEIVMIHSNAGITFDLQAIRQSLAGLDLTRFKAFGGLSEAIIATNKAPDVDFWVLVDGQIRYEKAGMDHIEGDVSFDIELALEDRFLTLIVTDGSRPERKSEWSNDFFYLIDPQITITETSN